MLVQESVHNAVVKKLEKRVEKLRLGDPLDKNTDIGAINSKDQLLKIEEFVQSGIFRGR